MGVQGENEMPPPHNSLFFPHYQYQFSSYASLASLCHLNRMPLEMGHRQTRISRLDFTQGILELQPENGWGGGGECVQLYGENLYKLSLVIKIKFPH